MSKNAVFTPAEIAQELERRRKAQRDLEEERRRALEWTKRQQADATCIHCGQPFISYTSSAAEDGLCDYCLHRD